jgi:dTDP-4-amino-4,6-dideoxygalactose transaminase
MDEDARFLAFGAPSIGREEIDEVVQCLQSGWIGTGPRVALFEKQFAAYKGVPDAAAVSSCSSGLMLALRAAGIGPGDEVITTPLTFCATINAIIHAGATPVLADVDPVSMNLDPTQVRARLTGKTRVVIPVHFAGRSCDMAPLLEIAAARNLLVIEDCAHAIETEYHGLKVGSLGDFGCFSFYATKNVTTGDGGMVLARRPEHLSTVRVLASQGMTTDAWKRFSDSGYRHYAVVDAGFKHNMTDIEAALGIHQLARVDYNWRRRQQAWLRYMEALADLPLRLPAPPEPETRHAYHLFTVLIDEAAVSIERDGFLEAMHSRRIGAAVHYLSVSEHPYYQQMFGWRPEDHPQAMRIGRQTVSLPLSPDFSEADLDRVVSAVRAAVLVRAA